MSFPLFGELIDGGAAREWLKRSLATTQASISVCSAYLRSEALLAVLPHTTVRLQGKILTRWQLGDLLSGASNLDAYRVARDRGLTFAVRLDFHGKVFCIPDQGIVVGSANATLAGLALKPQANQEICTRVEASAQNGWLVDQLFADATPLTDALFDEICSAVEDAAINPKPTSEWPAHLMAKLEAPEAVDRLLVSECLWASPEVMGADSDAVVAAEYDQELLGLAQRTADKNLATQRLVRARVFRWLLGTLVNAGGECYFGELSAALHNALLDSPAPNRRDVKSLLQSLLCWIEALPACGVAVDRPRHSQRVRLVT